MATVLVKQDAAAVAESAAALALQSLGDAIEAYGQAVWVVAGGTAPLRAYKILAEQSNKSLDWHHVLVAIGDERLVPLDSPEANKLSITAALLEPLAIPAANILWPDTSLVTEKAAKTYDSLLAALPQKQPGRPRFHHVWLGMGEDGHTLSLFPGNPALRSGDALVVPVFGSPKPPPVRVSLTLAALGGTESCLIIATGATKAPIIARALQGDTKLPVVLAVQAIEKAGGQVTWLLDSAAAGHAAQ